MNILKIIYYIMQTFDMPTPIADFLLDGDKNHEIENESISEKIIRELEFYPKINSDNFELITEEIIEKFGFKNENEVILVDAIVGAKANMSRNIDKIKMSEENKDKKILRKFAIEDASWMQKISDIIKSIKINKTLSETDKLKAINTTWSDLEKLYKNNEEYFALIKSKGEKHDLTFKGNKYGICGQLASESLMKEVSQNSNLLNVDSVAVESSTAEEDVDEKIDFFIIVTCGDIVSKIPCQVKARRYDNLNATFISQNLVTYVKRDTTNGFKESSEDIITSKYEEKIITKLEEFKKKVLKNYEEGLFFIIPYGDASYKKGKQKNRRVMIKILDDSGEVHEKIKDEFLEQFYKKFRDIDRFNNNVMIVKQNKKKGGQ